MQLRPGPATSAAYVTRSAEAARMLRVSVTCAAIGAAALLVAAASAIAAPLAPQAVSSVLGAISRDSFFTGGSLFVIGGGGYQATDREMKWYERGHGIEPGLFTRMQEESAKRRPGQAALN
jgi:hypothetical protein